MNINEHERALRTSALQLAVQTQGEPNKVVRAEAYLAFLKAGDVAQVPTPAEYSTSPSDATKRGGRR